MEEQPQIVTATLATGHATVLREARPQMVAARNELARRLASVEEWFAKFGKRRHASLRKFFPLMRHERAMLRAKLKIAGQVLAQLDAEIANNGT